MTANRKARTRRRDTERPGRPPGPGGHVGFAVAGCACLQCVMHRQLDREAGSSDRMAALCERTLGGAVYGVRLSPTASGGVRVALRAE